MPLFVEELTRAVLESGQTKPSGREIPVTLHDSLMARLDRLGPAKEVIQVGAVIGSEFSYELLRAVHPMAELDLQAALAKFTEAELLYVSGMVPDATYQCKHALIRDAAYEALLKSRRKELHRLVACTIDEKFSDIKQARPEVLARHWTEAGELEPAIAQWSRAGKAAQERNAFAEARENYDQALALLSLLPESPERDLRELELRQAAYVMMWMTKGWIAPETSNQAERIAVLAENTSSLTSLSDSLMRRSLGGWAAGELDTAGALAEQALNLALRDGNRTSLASRYFLKLLLCYWSGDLIGAEQHFLAGLEFFDDPLFRQQPIVSAVNAFGYSALNALALGQADIARERLARMMAAVDQNNPSHQVELVFLAAWFHLNMREYERAEALAARAVELSEQHPFTNYADVARFFLGAARAHLGRATDGIALLREGGAGMLRSGVRVPNGFYLALLAEAHNREGDTLAALETIDQALEPSTVYRPEVLRIRGELRAKQGQIELAENDLRDAIALAQKMSAKSWELRTTMSLARLLRDKGGRDQARAMLAEIYNWFTEGFDTADLKEAKALLDELRV